MLQPKPFEFIGHSGGFFNQNIMYINTEQLRNELRSILLTKTRNKVVTEIKADGRKMHQFQIDKFLEGRPVSIETILKFDEYIGKMKSHK